MAGSHNLQTKEAEAQYVLPIKQNYVPGKGHFQIISDSAPVAADEAAPGCEWIDSDDAGGKRYMNTGTAASPTWTEITGGSAGIPDPLEVDVINESTSNAGVTVDGVKCWNGRVIALKETFDATDSTTVTSAAYSNSSIVLGTGDVVSLPAGTAGQRYEFYTETVVTTAPQIDPNGTERIFINGTLQAAGKYISPGAIGDCLVLQCYATGVWKTLFVTGTWAVQG